LRSVGISEEKIHYCAQAVDNELWARECARYDRQLVRNELGIRGKAFLTVGRLVEGKGLQHLLLAWSRLPSNVRETNTLIVVGRGPEDPKLRQIVADEGLKTVLFAGEQSASNLAKYYAAADIFVFPSLIDVWGLVVNEAMACGLPVLASRFAGASQELIDNNDVGQIFDPTDLKEFTSVLREWSVRVAHIPRERPYAIVSRLNFDVTIEALRRVVTLYANSSSALFK
jgi:glycosyltransferase involved in cell wall biosynthesis